MITNSLTLGNGKVITYKVKTPRKRKPKYNHPKKQVAAAWLLDLIEQRGGMTYMQILKAIWERQNPDTPFDPKLHRGWWGTCLVGNGRGRQGILNFFCKREGRRYIRNAVDHEGQPYKVMSASNAWKVTTQHGSFIAIPNSSLYTGALP